MKQWIRDPKSCSALDLQTAAESCTSLTELRRFHRSQWAMGLNESHDINGLVLSLSMITFLACARLEPVLDSSKTVPDFTLLKLDPGYLHDFDPMPISRMTQQEACNTIEALEWHILSDPMHLTNRNVQWMEEIRELHMLLRSRLCFLCTRELDVGIMNMDEMRCVSKSIDSHTETNSGYDSDPELYKRRKKNKDIDLSEFYTTLATANERFVYICDTRLTTIERTLFAYDHLSWPEPGPNVDCTQFRKWIFDTVYTMQNKQSLNAQADWIESLTANESYERVYKCMRGLRVRVSTRRIILSKNENMICEPHTSMEDIVHRPVRDEKNAIRLLTDALFAHTSSQTKDIVSKIRYDGDPLEVPDGVWIYLDTVRNQWVIHMSHTQRFLVPSFTHAFIGMRKIMQDRNISPVIRKSNMGEFDSHF